MTSKGFYSEKILLVFILSGLYIIYFIHGLLYPALYLGGDSTNHFLISRYSWDHPMLLMHHWGKPFFTLVSSPFSQFGVMGMKLFNILCAIGSCYYVFKISKFLNIRRPLLAPLFLGFTVLYFFMTISGFTELLFGLLLVFCIYQYLNEKYFYSTILISFLPFIRSEGYLILPLFFLILFFNKKYKNVFLLLTGYIIYSIIGYFVYDDLFWLSNQNPYDNSARHIYGHGTLIHFFDLYRSIWGKPLAFLAFFGIVAAFFLRKSASRQNLSKELILVYGSFLIYFLAHVIFWWKGLFNSLGLERVMGAIMPVSAIISLRGWNLLLSLLPDKKYIKEVLTAIMLVLVIAYPFQRNKFPLVIEKEEKLILDVKKWYVESGFDKMILRKYYLHPEIPLQLEFDPYNTKIAYALWSLYGDIGLYGYEAVPDSSLIFWDAHYTPNEGSLPFEKLMSDPNFTLIKSFYPVEPFTTLGDKPFEIHVFQKIKKRESELKPADFKFYDLETTTGFENTNTLTKDKAFSGVTSCEVKSTTKYSLAILERTSSIANSQNINCIKLNAKISGSGHHESTAILSLHKDGEQTGYYSFNVVHGFQNDKWSDIQCYWKINTELLKSSDFIKVYFLNLKNQHFFIDDMQISFLDSCE